MFLWHFGKGYPFVVVVEHVSTVAKRCTGVGVISGQSCGPTRRVPILFLADDSACKVIFELLTGLAFDAGEIERRDMRLRKGHS